MSDDEVYSDCFDTDDDEEETTTVQTTVNAKKTNVVSHATRLPEKQEPKLRDLFNATLILLKRVEVYSVEHAEEWRAPTNMLEMLQLVQQVSFTLASIKAHYIHAYTHVTAEIVNQTTFYCPS